ncbi:MAG: penicillin-binding protein 2 [Anaerolineaceae bacterium]|jgi:cell division protein FtsI/penicillin-binding protein 2
MKINGNFRFNLVGIVLAVMGALVVLQMVRIQTSAASQQVGKDEANQYGYSVETVYPERGSIYDRWGNLLAGNDIVYEVGINLRVANIHPQTIAETASNLLDVDYNTALNLAQTQFVAGSVEYVTLQTFVPSTTVTSIKALTTQYDQANPNGQDPKLPSLMGLTFTPFLKRSYPEGNLAANVLGFYQFLDRKNGRGVYGIEGEYDMQLAGTTQNVVTPLDPYLIQSVQQVPPGDSLVLTIDRDIQASVETILDKALVDTKAQSGTIVVEDPKTGEILAMASSPRIDPNKYYADMKDFATDQPYNMAVGATYEPGSVFKVLTMAAGLDTGIITPSTQFIDTGVTYVDGVPIYNWDNTSWGPVDMVGCMQHSINICMVWIAQGLGPDTFYKYLKAFGIGQRTNIDLSGETLFPLMTNSDAGWHHIDLATNSFGQGLSVTPIQMVEAVSAVANQGRMMAPHVVKAIISDGQQYNINPVTVGAPISAKTAQTLTNLLSQSLVDEASSALVDGYSIAGKTGTAQIAEGSRYATDVVNASFVGWGPTDDPQFLVYIWLERAPGSDWGSTIAAPIFQKVVQQLVVQMDIPPDATRKSLQANGQ